MKKINRVVDPNIYNLVNSFGTNRSSLQSPNPYTDIHNNVGYSLLIKKTPNVHFNNSKQSCEKLTNENVGMLFYEII